MKKLKVVSLFSGCGGLDLGFQGGFDFLGKHYSQTDFEVVWANDIDKNACRSYAQYFNHDIVCGDLRDILDGTHISHKENPLPHSVDVVLGGFPCQDFSHSGKRKGFDSNRGTLYQSMSQVIEKTQPKMFLAENVKGLLTINKGSAVQQIIDDFSSLGDYGYHVSFKLLVTADFEVPQKRERVIIIGSRKDILPQFTFPDSVLTESRWINLGQAIGDLKNQEEGYIANHYWSKAKKNKGQGNNAVSKDKPGPTMRAEHHGNIEFHWNEFRRLSAREAARIQSFPDDFTFVPSTSSAYRQIGNAVPPVFAWHIAQSIQEFLKINSISKINNNSLTNENK
ncbi:MAG: DNA cytosine methyltransferase [Marinicellaceae bacterium]